MPSEQQARVRARDRSAAAARGAVSPLQALGAPVAPVHGHPERVRGESSPQQVEQSSLLFTSVTLKRSWRCAISCLARAGRSTWTARCASSTSASRTTWRCSTGARSRAWWTSPGGSTGVCREEVGRARACRTTGPPPDRHAYTPPPAGARSYTMPGQSVAIKLPGGAVASRLYSIASTPYESRRDSSYIDASLIEIAAVRGEGADDDVLGQLGPGASLEVRRVKWGEVAWSGVCVVGVGGVTRAGASIEQRCALGMWGLGGLAVGAVLAAELQSGGRVRRGRAVTVALGVWTCGRLAGMHRRAQHTLAGPARWDATPRHAAPRLGARAGVAGHWARLFVAAQLRQHVPAGARGAAHALVAHGGAASALLHRVRCCAASQRHACVQAPIPTRPAPWA